MSAASQYYSVTARVGVPHRHEVEVTVPLVGPAGPTGPAGTTDYNALSNKPTLGTAAAANLDALPETLRIVGGTDATKKVAFEVDALVSPNATRLLTVPNASGTLALSSAERYYNITATSISSPQQILLDDFEGLATGDMAEFRAILNNDTGIVYAQIYLPVDSPTIVPKLRFYGQRSGLGDITQIQLIRDNVVVFPASGSGYEELNDGETLEVVWNGTSYGLTPNAPFMRRIALPNASGTIALNETFAAPPSIGNTTPSTGAFTTLTATPAAGSTALTLTGGTVTASAPVIDATQTWNNSGVTFTGLAATITNTNSAAGSLVARLTVGSTNVFDVDGRGFTNFRKVSTSTDFVNIFTIRRGATEIFSVRDDATCACNTFSSGSSQFQNGQLALSQGSYIRWQSDDTTMGIMWDTHGCIGIRAWTGATSGTQAFRIYNTYTSSTNHERLSLRWASNVAIIGTEKGTGSPSGTARNLEFRTDNTARLTIGSAGTVTLNTTLAADAQNISTDITTGTKIGTATTQKIGFFNATPVIQQSGTGTNATGFTANGPGNTVHADSTFTGNVGATAYSISDIVKHLKTIGLIAS